MPYASLSLLGFILVFISDIAVRLNSYDAGPNGSTFLVGFANVVASIIFLFLSRKLNAWQEAPRSGRLVFISLVVWNVFTLIFGAFSANDYWAWKALLFAHLFIIIIPMAIIVGIYYDLFLKVFRTTCFVIFPLAVILTPYLLDNETQIYQRLIAPVMLLVLFSFYVPLRWGIFFVFLAVSSIAVDMGYRTNLVRFIIAIGLLGIVTLKVNWISRGWPIIVGVMFALPIVLLVLGVTDEFNIFRDNALYFDVTTRKDRVADFMEMNVDTRTFLYIEVFNSMIRRGSSFLIGEGGANGYDTDWFIDVDLNGQGRYGTEVGFLNILLHQGAIGVALYGAMLVVSCVIAIRSSNNKLCKMLGLFLMTRWILLFFEDIPLFDVNNYINWVVVGLCLSNRFRALTDEQLRELFSNALKNPLGRA
jgi:hypothetical protein